MKITRAQKWLGSSLLALASGLTALQQLDINATLYQKLVVFLAPACSTMAAATLHDPSAEDLK